MARFTARQLKFAILQALSSGPHQYKFNLLGKSNYPGALEHQLGVRFEPDERHTAVSAFDSLKAAGLIRPTYTDQIYPEDWVEITEAGRRALERRALDPLDTALAKIAPHLVELREGAWAAVLTDLPDSLRQAAHSARELIDQTLREGAPDNQVRLMPEFSPDSSSRTGITRRHRLRYLMTVHRGTATDSELKLVEKACDLVLETDERLIALAHSREIVKVDDVRDSIQEAEIALRRVLLKEAA